MEEILILDSLNLHMFRVQLQTDWFVLACKRNLIIQHVSAIDMNGKSMSEPAMDYEKFVQFMNEAY